jgi:hypothetical protein
MSYSGNFVDKSKIENNLGSCSIDGFGNTVTSEGLTTVGDILCGGGDIIYGLNQDANLKISPVVGADQQGKKLTLNGGQGTGAGPGGDIELKTSTFGVAGSNSNPLTTKMIIKQDGKVGISDTAPISELSVAGRLALTAEQSTPTAPTDGKGWLYSKSDGKIYWQSFDVAETDLTSGGGATALNDLTDVSYTSGDLVITSLDTITYANSLDANLKISPVSGANQNGKKLTISGGQGTGTGDGGDIEIQTAKSGVAGSNTNPLTTKMIIKEDGNVGIGTTSPQGTLHISSGTIGDCVFILEADIDNNNEGDNPRIEFRQDGGVAASSIYQTDNTLSIANSIGLGSIVFLTGTTNGYTNATERMRVQEEGNIGIGIKAPPNVLSTSPVQYNTGFASQNGNTVTGSGTTWTSAMVGSQIVFDGGGGQGEAITSGGIITGFNSPTSLTVSTSQTVNIQTYSIHYQGLQVKSDGKVGISDTAPISELSVAGKIALTAEQGTPTAPTDGNGWIYTKAGGDLYFQSFDIAEVSLTKKYREAWFYEDNVPSTGTQKAFLNGSPNYLSDYTAKNNGTITNMVLLLDDSDTFYTQWNAGTLTFRIDINATTVYTSTSYTNITYASAAAAPTGRTVTGVVAMVNLDNLSISYNKNDFISVYSSSSGLNAPTAGNLDLVVNLAMEER